MRIRIVDAFTDRPFAGNPAGVVVFDRPEFPSDEWMAQVAAEVNLSETAFVHPSDGEADYELRWFTPAVEVALCGHATLATAHVLGVHGTVSFATRSGVLTATTGQDGWITLDFPTAPLTPLTPDPKLLDVLGATPVSVHHTGPNTDDVLLELLDETAVRDLTPDLTTLAGYDQRGVIVTARADDPGSGYDFVSRFFGAAAGVGEDPVTGSAHTALAPFWSGRLGGRAELVGCQASRRGGLVRVSLRGDRTLLTGQAVTVIDGELLV
ncbi:PhzF family phenazine biosynthesis protein [Paractinoplanes brasiliensis]|uniref:PhzF family phenazine biosynthesis protein n=1 Tax=Paractinoplanes brasiliensis TaxID=52695 RepID=A0A4R6K070_9ACTN|nr:PhzF family phenazine biosynthesis protein [Actinoplanes brasiliensis]TDO40515.1 PhzF family phenazine biosynthesis protein [Actinoplanes brasiliensis]GID25584.1 oxidoreductase [Actinoplanes brasiliensis]